MEAGDDGNIAEATSRLGITNEKTTPPGGPTGLPSSGLSQPISRDIVARDITAEFSKASSALNTGQLIKDEWFTLFESVGALEIMDPKMDSGYLEPGETLDDEYDVSRALLPEEVLGIMDQLLCHEVAWHSGSPLAQTLFTSLYIDKLLWPEPRALADAQFCTGNLQDSASKPLLHKVLRAYSLSVVKCCGLVHERILKEHFYEEEDFVSHLCNRSLLPSVSSAEVLPLLEEAIVWLDGPVGFDSDSIKSALKIRLEFRKAFLQVLSTDVAGLKQVAPSLWEECGKILPLMQASHTRGTPVESSFSVKLQRRLASTVPPRPIVHLEYDDAMSHLKQLCKDGQDLNFVWTFQSRKPQPSIYTRAVLQSILFGDMKVLGRLSVKQLLFDDLAEAALPADAMLDQSFSEVELPSDPRFEINKRLEAFVVRAGPAEEIDAELQSFTKEEPIMNQSISRDPIFSFPLSSWAYHLKLRQMEWVIQLGFELEIYQPDELAGMYWYLQYISQTRVGHLERMRGFVNRKFSAVKKSHLARKVMDPTLKELELEAFTRTLSFLNFQMLEATAIHDFADTLSCIYTSLARLGLIPSQPQPYSTDKLQYELRMRPFLHISLPEFIPYEQLVPLVEQNDESLRTLLHLAQNSLARCRKDFDLLSKTPPSTSRTILCTDEWRASVKNVVRACIATGIALSRLEKEIPDKLAKQTNSNGSKQRPKKGDKTNGSGLKLNVDMHKAQAYHEWWLIPTLSSF
ncbi:MAG: hypothetical protein M4579_005488 [Chaenotheca gracillima]|nr:MAG: hypothetical protein M4579_005488 [Chaenotheca gracillima]